MQRTFTVLAMVIAMTISTVSMATAARPDMQKGDLANASVLGGPYINALTAAVASATGTISIVETRTKKAEKYSLNVKGYDLLPNTCYVVSTDIDSGGMIIRGTATTDEFGSFEYSQQLVPQDIDKVFVNQCGFGTVLFGEFTNF